MKPGQRQEDQNRTFKAESGSSPNGVANQWLAQRRGKDVWVSLSHGEEIVGRLAAFDAYSLRLEVGATSVLVFKGPGVVVRDASA
jgi:sRNA-binding regulator protein Hfq